MHESLTFNTNNVLPLMRINRAMYGNPRDLKQVNQETSFYPFACFWVALLLMICFLIFNWGNS